MKDPAKLVGELIKSKYTDKTAPVEFSGWKIKQVNREVLSLYCQRCGHYNVPELTQTSLALIGEREFKAFTCAKCGDVAVAPQEVRSTQNPYEWLRALKNKISVFKLK